MAYKIELADGTVLENVELNGNNFIPENPIADTVFKDNLTRVKITGGEGNIEEHENMKVFFAKIGEVETFILQEKTLAEIEKELLQQRIDDLELYILQSEGLI